MAGIKKIEQVPLTNQNDAGIILNKQIYRYQYKMKGA